MAKRKKSKPISKLRKIAWDLLSKIIRQTGLDHKGEAGCYTCGVVHHWRDLQAGHGIGGRHNAVLFDEDIIRKQCCGCNIFKRGNYPVFAAKLVREHGIDWWEDKLAGAQQIKYYTRTDLEELIESYRQRLTNLEIHEIVKVFDELDKPREGAK